MHIGLETASVLKERKAAICFFIVIAAHEKHAEKGNPAHTKLNVGKT